MRKYILVILMFISLLGNSQVKIQMQEDGGVYKIPCEVNGLRMKFIFDTGASNVCISLTEAKFMLENEYISYDDIVGTSESQIADGSIIENTRIILKEIKIANLILRDVEAVVTHSFGAPLLLGQSAIQKLGTIQIVGDELTIIEHKSQKTDEEIDAIFEEARSLYSKELYTAASRKYQELYNLDVLSNYGVFILAKCYYFAKKYDMSVMYFNKVKDLTDFTNKEMRQYYDLLGWAYLKLKDYDNAMYNFELESMYDEDVSVLYGGKYNIAMVYEEKKDYYKAISCYEELLNLYLSTKDISPEAFLEQRRSGKIEDDVFDNYMFSISYCYYKQTKSHVYLEHIGVYAKMGNKLAIQFINDMDLEYLLR